MPVVVVDTVDQLNALHGLGNASLGISVSREYVGRKFPELMPKLQFMAKGVTGGIAATRPDHRFIYYIVTKLAEDDKATYLSVYNALQALLMHVTINNVTEIIISPVGSDSLRFCKVKSFVEGLFADTEVRVHLCKF